MIRPQRGRIRRRPKQATRTRVHQEICSNSAMNVYLQYDRQRVVEGRGEA